MTTGLGKKAPVCMVCGDESSGFHYGVDSCEGCKGFFRRCITQGMHHRCSNSEKCDITPFTRNSCQYCRLKKCFAVGMSREASRLGRRPKKMKDVAGDGVKLIPVNIPIAPYPSQSEIYQMRMADLQRILQQNGTFKSELMEAFNAAQKLNVSADTKPDAATLLISTESGYSSLSSPSSSKSQSPVHMGYIVSQMAGTQLTQSGGHTAVANSGYATLLNGNHGNGSMVVVKEEPELDACGEDVNDHVSDAMTMNGGPYLSMVGGDLMNGITDMSMLMPDMINGQLMDMDDGAISEMDIGQMDEMCRGPRTDLVDVKHEEYDADDVYNDYDIDTSPRTPTSDLPPLLLPPNNTIPTPSPLQGNPFFDSSIFDVKRIVDIAQSPMTDSRLKLINFVTQSIRDAHSATCTCTRRIIEDNITLYNHKKALSTLGDFQQLDVNPSLMWQQFVAHMVPEITLVVKFCKKLPGFQEITQDDQILLIKQGSFEVLLIRFLLLIDVEAGEMFDPGMQVKCSRNVIINMPMGMFFDEFFKIADRFNPLKLNDLEIAMFAAITMMCPDRRSLFNRKNVAKIQTLFFQTLFYQLQKSHEDSEMVFRSLLSIMPLLRAINDQHSKALNDLKMSNPQSMKDLPDLHKEVFDINE